MTGIADPDKFQQSVREQTGPILRGLQERPQERDADAKSHPPGGRRPHQLPSADIEKYYEEHKTEFVRQEQIFLREILVSTEGKNAAGVAAAEKKAKDLVARARKGEKFGELARDNSDAVTAKNYGDLGTPFKRGDLNKQLEDAVFDKDKGYVTDPIRVPSGFLILKVEEKHKAGQAGSRRGTRPDHGEALHAAHAARGPRVPDEAAHGRVSRDQARLRGRLCRSRNKDTAWRDPGPAEA